MCYFEWDISKAIFDYVKFNFSYIFIEFKERSSAEEAVRQRNNHKLDKNHTFLCNIFTDFEKYNNVPEEFTAPEPQPYKVRINIIIYFQSYSFCSLL